MRFTASNTQEVEISNVDFKNGNASNSSSDNNRGGMIYATGAKKLVIRNCTFTDCITWMPGECKPEYDGKYYGGTIYLEYVGEVIIENCTFKNTKTPGSEGSFKGGFIYIGNGCTKITIKDSSFENGRSRHAGAINICSSTMEITGCTFKNNRASYNGGAVNFSAGTKLTISGCTFSGNRCGGDSSNDIYKSSSSGTLIYNGSSYSGEEFF